MHHKNEYFIITQPEYSLNISSIQLSYLVYTSYLLVFFRNLADQHPLIRGCGSARLRKKTKDKNISQHEYFIIKQMVQADRNLHCTAGTSMVHFTQCLFHLYNEDSYNYNEDYFILYICMYYKRVATFDVLQLFIN